MRLTALYIWMLSEPKYQHISKSVGFVAPFFLPRLLLFARHAWREVRKGQDCLAPKNENPKMPNVRQDIYYHYSWTSPPRKLETPRLALGENVERHLRKRVCPLTVPLSWALAQYMSGRWHLSASTLACTKQRKTRGIFFACFWSGWEAMPLADSCDWIQDQPFIEKI